MSRKLLVDALHLEQDRPADAIKVATDCLHVNGEAPYCHDILIKAYEAMGDTAQAATAIAECRQNRDGDYFCIQKERDALIAKGDMAGARRVVDEAFAGGSEASRQEILSRFYQFTGERDKAWLAMSRACEAGDQPSCANLAKDED